MSYKSGTVAAKNKMADGRYCLRFDRANPKEGKSLSFYVYLLEGAIPPEVGATWRREVAELREIDSLGGMDTYECIHASTSQTPKYVKEEAAEEAPKTAEIALDPEDPHFQLMLSAVRLCSDSGVTLGVKDREEQEDLIVGAACTILGALSRFKVILAKEQRAKEILG